MKLTVLGSGIYVFKEDRLGPSFLLEAGDTLFLFDCGWGFGLNLIKSGHTIYEIDHIFISHPHADHMGSLMNIMQSMTAGSNFPQYQRKKPLYLHGYKGFKKDYEMLRKILAPERGLPYESYEIILHEYEDNKRTFGDIAIRGMKVRHNPNFHSAAFRVDYHNSSFVYSGDTCYDENLIKLSKNAHFVLFEASNPTKVFKKLGPKPNHLSPFECGLIAQKAGVKKLGLIHIYYDFTTKEEMRREVKKNYTGEVVFPSDLESFVVV